MKYHFVMRFILCHQMELALLLRRCADFGLCPINLFLFKS